MTERKACAQKTLHKSLSHHEARSYKDPGDDAGFIWINQDYPHLKILNHICEVLFPL